MKLIHTKVIDNEGRIGKKYFSFLQIWVILVL